MPEYVTQSDLEAQYGAHQVRAAFTDNGAASVNTANLQAAIVRASAVADAILGRAYPSADQRAALAEDAAIKACIATLVMAYGTERRAEFRTPAGETLYAVAARHARKDLELIASAGLRPATEATAGANPVVRGASVPSGARQRFFSPSRHNPKPRGF